jgi:hypothetical protein
VSDEVLRRLQAEAERAGLSVLLLPKARESWSPRRGLLTLTLELIDRGFGGDPSKAAAWALKEFVAAWDHHWRTLHDHWEHRGAGRAAEPEPEWMGSEPQLVDAQRLPLLNLLVLVIQGPTLRVVGSGIPMPCYGGGTLSGGEPVFVADHYGGHGGGMGWRDRGF